MSNGKDGGPAFPASRMEEGSSPEAEAIGGHFEVQYPGMSLRDYFAAKALQAVPMPQSDLHDIIEAYDRIAQHAYKMADAMIRARGEA